MLARPTLFFVVLSLSVACGFSHPYDVGIVFEDSNTTSRPAKRTTRPPRTTTVAAPSSTANVPTVTLPPFTANETSCFAQQKMLYVPDGKCYKLHQQGPCSSEEHWLVLDKDEAVRPGGGLRPVCQACMCCTRLRQVFWPADGKCHKLSEKDVLCPFQGTILQSDPFGEGECVCNNEPPYARFEAQVLNDTDAVSGVCYPLYHRGPCDRGQVLTKSALKGYGSVGHCTRDSCHEQNRRSTNGTYAMYEGDKRCYQLGSTGHPCASDESFNVHTISHKPECIRRLNNIFKLPTRCQADTSGDCPQEINLSEDDKTLFALELLMSADKRKKRRSRNGLD